MVRYSHKCFTFVSLNKGESMKKFIYLLGAIAALTACGDDDEPYTPELNKLTNVTCTKNGVAFFQADITYDEQQRINRIVLNQEGTQSVDNYIFVDNTLSVSGTQTASGDAGTPFVHTRYTLSGNTITRKEEMAENPYANHAVYTQTASSFQYNGNALRSVSQVIRSPLEGGSDYQTWDVGEVARYVWEDGNVVYYDYLPEREMAYEYDTQLCPANFPFRVVDTFRPVDFAVVSPLNQMYGAMNRNLPSRAYWYAIASASTVQATYAFHYTFTGDYITGMTIEEQLHPTDGTAAETNTYVYTFIYNFTVQ